MNEVSALPARFDAADPSQRSDADREAIRRLAQEFEALLMTHMLREMRRSMLDEDEKERGFGAGVMADTVDVELGRALSQVGGFGLSDVLVSAFTRLAAPRMDGRSQPVAALELEARRPSKKEPATIAGPDPSTSLEMTAAAPVSSAFGWRSDPLTGAPRFHRGIDFAIAYGQDVRAAAPGRVIFAGRQRGYGTTVVVEHGDGRQTRYAHLSQELVRAGDEVAGGQVLGKSGNSGRSTAPHLHFEMLVNGQPIDPRSTEKSGSTGPKDRTEPAD